MTVVSVVMPTFNSAATVGDSIRSVQEQSFNDWELLIVDDCSTDSTVEIVEEFALKDARIRLIQNETNQGAGHSRNRAIEMAAGRYIAFLDSDDLWLPEKLSVQMNYARENGSALMYSGYQKFSSTGMGGIVMPPTRVTYSQLLNGCVIGCLTAVYDTQQLGKVFMPTIRKRQDYGLWLKLLEKIDEAHGIPQVLAEYRTDSGMTKNKLSTATEQWKFYRNVLGFGLLKTSYHFVCYAWNGFIKYVK